MNITIISRGGAKKVCRVVSCNASTALVDWRDFSGLYEFSLAHGVGKWKGSVWRICDEDLERLRETQTRPVKKRPLPWRRATRQPKARKANVDPRQLLLGGAKR